MAEVRQCSGESHYAGFTPERCGNWTANPTGLCHHHGGGLMPGEAAERKRQSNRRAAVKARRRNTSPHAEWTFRRMVTQKAMNEPISLTAALMCSVIDWSTLNAAQCAMRNAQCAMRNVHCPVDPSPHPP